MIFIGADHRGFELKERLKQHLIDEGFEITDLGNDHLDPVDDYVLFAEKVAEAVVEQPDSQSLSPVSSSKSLRSEDVHSTVAPSSHNFGIILCGSGAGVDMVANKIDGVRSALVFDVPRAIQAREHENANVISLPADTLDETSAFEIVKAFLTTEFKEEERHERRLEEMEEVEQEN